MNINQIYYELPNPEEFLCIHTEQNSNEISCICMVGVSEKEMDETFIQIEKKANELNKMYQHISHDILLKPIFLFDSLETCLLFVDTLNTYDKEVFIDLIEQLQHDYNTPYTHVKMFTYLQVLDILEN